MPAITPLMQNQVTQLYIGFFGRAPDAVGFGYWVNGMSNGVTQQQIANSFSTSPEFVSNYAGLTPSQAVTKMYNNILNRAPDAAGLTFWANSIANGQNTLATCVTAILNSCVAQGTGTADGALVANKTAVGEYFAITLASNDTAVAATAYNTVTSDPASVATAQASLVTAAATQINITSAVPGTFTAGASNTTFNALGYIPPGTATVVNTLVNGDSLIGNANYTNTLNTALVADSNVTPAALTNIQNLVLTNSGTATLNLSNASANGFSNVSVNALGGNQTISGVQNAAATYSLNNLTTGALTVTLGSGVASGTNDTIRVTANKVSGTTTFVTVPTAFETMQLTSVAGTTNTIQTNFAGATTAAVTGGVTILGGGNLTFIGSAASTISAINVNASAFTGNLTSTMSDNVTTSILGGSGNDAITLLDANAATATGVTVNMGNGDDTLIMQSLAQVSSELSIVGGVGTDTLTLTDITTGDASTLRNVSLFETLRLNFAGTTTSNVITLGTNFINAGFTSVISSGTGDNITVANATLTGQAFSNSLTGTGTGTLVLNTAAGTVTATNLNAVTLDNGSTAMNMTVQGTGDTTTVTANRGTQTISLGASSNNNVTLAGDARFAVTGGANTGNTVVLGSGTGTTGAATVTGGAGGLVANISASTAANTVVFTAGTNTLTAASLQNVSAATSITGGSGTDTLAITNIQAGAFANDKSLDSVNSGIEVLRLNFAGTTTSNVITLGTNFTNAGFTSVVSTGTGDNITVANATLSGQVFTSTLTGTGTGTLVLNTASGTVTASMLNAVTLDNGSTAMNITVTGTGDTTTLTANRGTQTISLGTSSNNSLILAGDARFAVTGGANTGNTVVLGSGTGTTGAATVTGGAGGLVANISASTAANTVVFTAGTNTLTAASLQNVSAAASITGGSAATDTLTITGIQAGAFATDLSLDSVQSGIETLRLGFAGTTTSNVITLGTNFTNAGFTSVVSTGTGDNITVTGATLTGQLFSNTGAATGSGTLTLNTAGGTVSVNNYAAIVGNGATNTLSLNGTGTANTTINLRAGSSVINLNTFASTIVLTGASTYLGNMAAETITLGSGAAQTITGGGGNDVVTLGGNTSNATVTVGLTGSTVNTGTLSVVGSSTAIDAVTISGAGTYATTGVNTVTMQAVGTTLSANTIINNTAGMSVVYSHTLAAGSTANFTFGAIDGAGTGGTIVVSATAVGNDVITMNAGDWFSAATETANTSVLANGGRNTINLTATGVRSYDRIGVSLATLGNSTNTSNAFVVTNFDTTGGDSVNFYGSTLTSAAGNTTAVLNQNYVDASGNNNTNSYTLGTTFVTGTSTALTGSLANLTTSVAGAANSNGLIFAASDSASLIGTANFTLQSGIDMAVSYITTNIGISGTGATQKAVIAVNDGVAGGPDTALFLFTSDGTSGIVASELKLIGTLSSNGTLSASNFS